MAKLFEFSLKKAPGFEKAMKEGAAKIAEATDRLVENSMREFARQSVVEAIQWYDEGIDPKRGRLSDNTRTSFCAGIYHNGSIDRIEIGYRIAGVQAPFHYVYLKSGNFMDRGSGEYVTSVREYSKEQGNFVEVDTSGYAYLDTQTFLNNFSPTTKKGWCVVVASISPYVEMLHDIRHFDILESSVADHKNVLREAIKSSYRTE